MDTVATGLDVPWGLAFLPDGTALVAERDSATVKSIGPDGTIATVATIPGVEPGGEGGLLGLAVAPDVAETGKVFVYFTAAEDNRVVVMTLGAGLADPKPIVTGIPKAGNHNGGRIEFGPDGNLYIGTGDAGNRDGAQDLSNLGGKILRVKQDGTAAAGNPFPQAPLVYSYGHRNVQGLAFDDRKRLWAAEFGQNTWDELNLITPGGNYGWPVVEGPSDDVRFVAPQRMWATIDASPSGVAVWSGSVWMAGLAGNRLWQIPLTGDGTGEPIAHLQGEYGRLRTVSAAPDGSLWVTTSNTDGRGSVRDGDDRILRLTTS